MILFVGHGVDFLAKHDNYKMDDCQQSQNVEIPKRSKCLQKCIYTLQINTS